jgi:hypothetical protein
MLEEDVGELRHGGNVTNIATGVHDDSLLHLVHVGGGWACSILLLEIEMFSIFWQMTVAVAVWKCFAVVVRYL